MKENKETKEILAGICLHCGNVISGNLTCVNLEKIVCNHCNHYGFIGIKDLNVMTNKVQRDIMLLIGPTGSGKNFLLSRLKNLNYINVPSVTTRNLRDNEKAGEDYITVSQLKFEEMLSNDELCEHVKFGSNRYGVSVATLVNLLWNTDHNLTIIVEPNGYIQMMNWFACHTNFIEPLNVKISRVFLDIPRNERFLNLLKDTSEVSFKQGLCSAFDNIINPGNTLSVDAFDDTKTFMKHLDSILNRLVRNGDSIAANFSQADTDIQSKVIKLEKVKIPSSLEILKCKDDIDSFILSKKNDKYNIVKLLETIKAIDDTDVLNSLLQAIRDIPGIISNDRNGVQR